ncbi:MAG: hypothetical protein MJH09_09670 [Cetobacterium sp.]|nr:hypothetical protein [Cetobacterium sp.]
MEFWMGAKMLLGNRGKVVFSLLGITGAVTALIMTLALGEGGREVIDSDLSAIGGNRILIGGRSLNSRDLETIESMPFVEYGLFPEGREYMDDYVFIGYPKRALLKKGIDSLGLNEVIIDRSQIDRKVGEILNIEGKNYLIRGTYEEKNPLETMKRGRRIIVSMETLNRNFGRRDYRSMVIAFPQGENSQEYIPVILNTLSRYRGLGSRVQLLETPEIYKSVERVRVLVNRVLFTLSFIALGVGTFGVMNLIGASVKSNISTMGILKSMGMERGRIIKIFLYQGLIVIGIGGVLGIVLGVIGSYLGGIIINIPPKFNILEIVGSLGITMVISLGLGIRPGIEGSKISVMEALKE